MARVTKMVQETVVPDDDAVDDTGSASDPTKSKYAIPLFEAAGLDPAKVPGGISVTREDPPDGYIGYYPPDTTTEDLKRLVGGYVLSIELKDARGRIMQGGAKRMVRIDAPPVATAAAKANAAEARGQSALAAPDQLVRMLEIQRTAIDEIRTRANDSVAIMRAELEGSTARRAAELDASLRRMQEEAKIRSEEADAKHKRELELARTYQEAQLTREREQRMAEAKQHSEMIGMIQQNNAQQTQVVVASMQNKTDPMAVITQMFALAAPLLPLLSGQGDPAVEITKAVSNSLESMSKMVTTDKPADGAVKNGKEIVRANGNGAAKNAPSADAGDKKQRLIAKVGKLFQAVNGAGMDPEAILDQAIAHYEQQGKDEEVDEPDEEEQTPEHARKRARRPTRSRAKPAAVARRAGAEPKPASQSAVGRRAKTHGRPAAAGSTRSDSAGSKRHGKA